MAQTIDNILAEIKKERDYQEERWGDEFDAKNTVNDWAAYIIIELGKAISIGVVRSKWRKIMIGVATLAVAAVQRYDEGRPFPARHYDSEEVING